MSPWRKRIGTPLDKLLDTAIRQFDELAKAHDKQFKRTNRQIKFLRSRLGRLIREIRGKIDGDEDLQEAFAAPLSKVIRIRTQKQRQRG